MLRQMGAKKVTASSISDVKLRRMRDLGYLEGIEVRALNAERLDLPDGSVDLILCKEAFHHFPRAPLAFYEFMRVSRLGFILIEPAEFGGRRMFDFVRTLAKVVLRKRPPVYELFEPVGNFIYRVSRREIYRMLAAAQSCSWFAILAFNDFSMKGLVDRPKNDPLAHALFAAGLFVQDALSRCGLMNPGFCAVFVPTGADALQSRERLVAAGFRIVDLPRNPYPPEV